MPYVLLIGLTSVVCGRLIFTNTVDHHLRPRQERIHKFQSPSIDDPGEKAAGDIVSGFLSDSRSRDPNFVIQGRAIQTL